MLRIALVGCGKIARLHAERIAADGRAQFVAFCDPVRGFAESARDAFAPEALVVSDLAMFPEGLCDAAVICTPTNLHFDQIRWLRERGVHVLCEKPLADSRQRIAQLIHEAGQGGALLTVGYQRRCWSAYRTLRREVQSGRFGPVRAVTMHNSERWQQTIAGTWRDDPLANPCGFIGDAGSHKMDVVFFVTGLAPREVFAHSDLRKSRVDIVTTISARLEQGVSLGMTFVGDAQHFREDFYVHCAEADLFVRDGAAWIARDNRTEPIASPEPESNPDAAFVDCLTLGAENFAPPSVALPVWDFTQAVIESAKTGRIVRIGEGESKQHLE